MSQENRSMPLLPRFGDKIQYLSEHCSLTWLGYVLTPYQTPLIKRLFWLATITGCCACSALVLRGALSLYTSGAVSYSVETDYLEWETPFPALTVCEYLNTGRVKKYLQQNKLPLGLEVFSQEVSFWDKKICRTCTSCERGETCVEDFLELIDGIRLKCPDLLTKCWWNDEYFPCCERFLPIDTEYGTCFVFNSRWTGNESTLTVKRNTGLPTLTFSATQKISIRIHSPDDLITIASENLLNLCSILPRVSELNVLLRAEQTVSHVSVQQLSPDNRDCLYKNEQPGFAHHWPFNRYSYSACIMYRRSLIQIEACNCTHHFMPQIGSFPKCDINGLACLYQLNKETSSDYYDCPMACEEVSYEEIHVKCSRITNLSEELSRRGTQGHIRLAYLPTLRVRRHAIRELLGLVVDIGGVIGVFFGASLLSFIEIVYILFLRKYT